MSRQHLRTRERHMDLTIIGGVFALSGVPALISLQRADMGWAIGLGATGVTLLALYGACRVLLKTARFHSDYRAPRL